MNGAMKEKQGYWIGGTLTALIGVALVKLLAPELSGALATLALASGYILVVAGITIISFATRRKRSDAFITVAKNAKERNRP